MLASLLWSYLWKKKTCTELFSFIQIQLWYQFLFVLEKPSLCNQTCFFLVDKSLFTCSPTFQHSAIVMRYWSWWKQWDPRFKQVKWTFTALLEQIYQFLFCLSLKGQSYHDTSKEINASEVPKSCFLFRSSITHEQDTKILQLLCFRERQGLDNCKWLYPDLKKNSLITIVQNHACWVNLRLYTAWSYKKVTTKRKGPTL